MEITGPSPRGGEQSNHCGQSMSCLILQNNRVQEMKMSENNPFFSVSLLPYQAPRFDLIDVSHYRPAFDEGVRRQRAEIAAIVIIRSRLICQHAGSPGAERPAAGAGDQRLFAMAGADTNPAIQALDEQFSSELAELANDIWLNDALFQRVKQVWSGESRSPLTPNPDVCWR
jgi:peptidyl-dipeptidase Dcp